MAYVCNSNDVFRYVWIGRNMTRTCNYIIAFLSKDRDIVLEPLATFAGDTMFFNTKEDAEDYIDRLLDRNGLGELEPFENSEGLQILRVQ